MNCHRTFNYDSDIFIQDPNFFHFTSCNFPGKDIFHLMRNFEDIDKKINDYLYDVTIHKAWLTDYNVRYGIFLIVN